MFRTMYFAQLFTPAQSGCEMFHLSAGYAYSHPLNTDVKEHRSGRTAENHPQHPAVPGSTRFLRISCAIAAGWTSTTSHSEQCESEVKELRPANPPLLPWQPCCCRRSVFYTVFFEGLEKEANIHLYVYSFAAHCYLCKWKRERIQNALKELRLSWSFRAIYLHVVFCCL